MDLIAGTPFPKMFDLAPSNKYLDQGDVIKLFNGDYKISNRQYGAVGHLVASNSCDLEHGNVRAILLVPIYPFDMWYRDHSEKNLSNLVDVVYDEIKYERKATFFMSPLCILGNKPLVAFVDDIKSIPFSKHIFKWQNVPGPDEERMKLFISEKFGIDWIIDSNIEKTENDGVINASHGEQSLALRLNDDKTKVSLTLSDGKIIDLIAIREKKDELLNIAFSNHDLLLKHRICSMKHPWREQLGHKLGNLFNRVSTYTPEKNEVKSWTKIYKEDNSKVHIETRGQLT